MRVLIISAAYAPDPGGVATHVVNLVRGLIKSFEDISVDVLTLRSRGMPYKKDPKGRLIEWKLDHRTVPEFNGRRVVFERFLSFALENWHELRPDLIHVHDFDSLQIGWLLRTAFSVPLVLTVHRAPTEWRSRRYCENEKDCFMEAARVHKFVDKIVVPSEASAKVLKDQGFKGIKIIPHGISQHLLTFEPEAAVLDELNLPLDIPLVFCPCRADEHKDLPIFIRAAGLLHDQLETPAAFLVTSRHEDSESSEARELSLIAPLRGLTEGKDIFFTKPFKYGSALAAIYRRSSVVVVPSLHESFGQNVLDAFMFGKPVVARNSMALKEIVHHEGNGLLFETARELAWQVRRLLHDPELVARIVETARQGLTQRFDVDRMAREYRVLYDEVVRRNRR